RRPPAPITEQVREVAVVVRRGSRVLVVQQPAAARRWANLWEFPHDPVLNGESPEDAARCLLSRLTGVEAELGPQLATLTPRLTRVRITLCCLEASYRS